MKKLSIFAAAAVLLTALTVSCSQPAEDDDDIPAVNTKAVYAYTTTVGSASSTHYFTFNSDGTIARAGIESEEYESTNPAFTSLKNSFTYAYLCKDTTSTFAPVDYAKMPYWVNKLTEEWLEGKSFKSGNYTLYFSGYSGNWEITADYNGYGEGQNYKLQDNVVYLKNSKTTTTLKIFTYASGTECLTINNCENLVDNNLPAWKGTLVLYRN
jgi:hypothetical protein